MSAHEYNTLLAEQRVFSTEHEILCPPVGLVYRPAVSQRAPASRSLKQGAPPPNWYLAPNTRFSVPRSVSYIGPPCHSGRPPAVVPTKQGGPHKLLATSDKSYTCSKRIDSPSKIPYTTSERI
ncbi:hypothetical protein Bbelb_290760 [Branchiostoma belcheri]|nr:hypothetical protein Bbelb_290760 [Branchiostoma belcheri]